MKFNGWITAHDDRQGMGNVFHHRARRFQRDPNVTAHVEESECRTRRNPHRNHC